MKLDGAVVWHVDNEELILRIPGSTFYVRVQPKMLGNSMRLVYDYVVEVSEGVWAVPPDKE